jgi:hypothetical protein
VAEQRNPGTFHPAVLIPRPRTPEGRLLVRYGVRLSTTARLDLSTDICAVCGYGLTKLQMQRYQAEPQAPHRAIPLAELAAWQR